MVAASVTRRVFAFLIDHIIIIVFGSGSFFIMFNPVAENITFPSIGHYTIFVLTFLIFIFRDIINSASIGKRFLGLKIVNSEEPSEPVSVAKLGLRNLFIPLWPLELLVMVFNSRNRRIGDMVAKTQVLYSKDWISSKFRLSIVSIFLAFLTILFVHTFANIRKTPSYQLVSDYVLSDERLFNEIGEIKSLGKCPSLDIRSNAAESVSMISFKISGQKGTKRVRGFLRKIGDSEWKIEKVEYFE